MYLLDFMGDEYQPEWVEGEILVKFHDKCDYKGFARGFGSVLGFKLIDLYSLGDSYLFEVPAGKEDDACRTFSSYNLFVEWTARRDLKYERRSDNHAKLEEMVDNFDWDAELPDDEYQAKLDALIEYIKSIK